MPRPSKLSTNILDTRDALAALRTHDAKRIWLARDLLDAYHADDVGSFDIVVRYYESEAGGRAKAAKSVGVHPSTLKRWIDGSPPNHPTRAGFRIRARDVLERMIAKRPVK